MDSRAGEAGSGRSGEERFVLDHVAIALPSVAAGARVLVAELGGKPFAGGPGVGFQGGQWEFAGGERIELIEPWGPADGFLHRFLARRGPGVHHVTFKVPSFGDACARVESRGYALVGVDASNPGWKEAFLHPKQAQGIVVQLAESDPELDTTWGPSWSFPPLPENPPPPAFVRALHLSACSEGEARRQWEEILGGAAEGRGGEWRFRWPDSPLVLVVHVDPTREPGPLHLEVAGLRAPVSAEAERALGVPIREGR